MSLWEFLKRKVKTKIKRGVRINSRLIDHDFIKILISLTINFIKNILLSIDR